MRAKLRVKVSDVEGGARYVSSASTRAENSRVVFSQHFFVFRPQIGQRLLQLTLK